LNTIVQCTIQNYKPIQTSFHPINIGKNHQFLVSNLIVHNKILMLSIDIILGTSA